MSISDFKVLGMLRFEESFVRRTFLDKVCKCSCHTATTFWALFINVQKMCVKMFRKQTDQKKKINHAYKGKKNPP